MQPTRKRQLMTSEAIFACGGSSSLFDGLKLCLRQDSRSVTKPGACRSIEAFSRIADVTRVIQISTTLWSLSLCKYSGPSVMSWIFRSTCNDSNFNLVVAHQNLNDFSGKYHSRTLLNNINSVIFTTCTIYPSWNNESKPRVGYIIVFELLYRNGLYVPPRDRFQCPCPPQKTNRQL